MGMTESGMVRGQTLGSILLRYRGYVYGASIFVGVYFVYLLFTPLDIDAKHVAPDDSADGGGDPGGEKSVDDFVKEFNKLNK